VAAAPIFASIELARRIEHAEARLSASMGQAVLTHAPQARGFVDDVGGGVAVYAGPSSPMNKMIGVGFEAMPEAGRLQAIEQKFRSRGAVLQAEVSTLADPAFALALTRRGYLLQGFENVLGRAIADGAAWTTEDGEGAGIVVRGDEDVARWLDVAMTGFSHADAQGVQAEALPPRAAFEAALMPLTRASGLRRYVAWIGGEIAGVATLRIDDGIAQLCGAATLPLFRRRGVQTTLLRRRLADAADDGCSLALMTTQPGSKSQENGYRQGFAPLYSRAVLVREPV